MSEQLLPRAVVQAVAVQINEQTLSVADAATAVGVTPQTMWRRVRRGTVPAFAVAGVLRIWASDIQQAS